MKKNVLVAIAVMTFGWIHAQDIKFKFELQDINSNQFLEVYINFSFNF